MTTSIFRTALTPRPIYWRRPWLAAAAAFVVAVALLAGSVHIVTVLLVPTFAPSDGWSRLSALAGTDTFAEIATTSFVPIDPGAASAAGSVAPAAASVPGLDPLFVNAACRLRLADAPAAIALDARDEYWSLALYDARGVILFSINDRTAADGVLDMLVVTPAQNVALSRSSSPADDGTVVVESASTDLVALLRLYAPDAAGRRKARQALAGADCAPAPDSTALRTPPSPDRAAG